MECQCGLDRFDKFVGLFTAIADVFAVEIGDLNMEELFGSADRGLLVGSLEALGRLIVVVHTPRGNKTRLISARKASKGESEQYDA